jgi:nucleotide-binding universal stress UspA family protein
MYKNIVIPVDLSDKKNLNSIFPPALHFVNAFGSKIHLIYIIPDFGIKMVEDYLPRQWLADQKQKYFKQMEELIAKFIPEEIKAECYVGRGAIYDQVISYADKVEADLIIVSAVRPQFKGYMLGPNASKIVRHSAISVLVARE